MKKTRVKEKKLKSRKENYNYCFKHSNENLGITLIALVVTIVLNCSFLAMV